MELKKKKARLNLVEDDSGRALPTDVNKLFQVVSPKAVELAAIHAQKQSQTYLITWPVGFLGLDAMITARP